MKNHLRQMEQVIQGKWLKVNALLFADVLALL